MRCNGLPNANDPSDLRKYIHMWMESMQQNTKKEMNWLLKINEQSILTQDQSVLNMSKENLKKMQTNFGSIYAKRCKEVLGILYEIEGVVRDKYSLSISKMEDLLDVSMSDRTLKRLVVQKFFFLVKVRVLYRLTYLY